MPDLTIANAATLTGAGTASGDLFPLLDISASAGSQGSKITRDELRIGMGITGGGTLATGGFTLTVPATGTAALLGTANVFTAAQTISVAGANSTPPLYLTGSLNVAGSGTTTFPHIFHQPTGATAATTWSSGANAGTVFGANETTGFVGNFLDFRLAGATRAFLTADGKMSLSAQNVAAYGVEGQNSHGLGSASGGCALYSNGAAILQVLSFSSGVTVSDAVPFGWRSGDVLLYRKAAATLQLGADAAGVTNQMFTAASRITSDGVGANLTIAAGNGRGGAGGTLIFSTYSTAGAGVIGTLTTRMTIDTAGAIAFPNVTAVVTETVVSDCTLAVSINGTAYKICLKA